MVIKSILNDTSEGVISNVKEKLCSWRAPIATKTQQMVPFSRAQRSAIVTTPHHAFLSMWFVCVTLIIVKAFDSARFRFDHHRHFYPPVRRRRIRVLLLRSVWLASLRLPPWNKEASARARASRVCQRNWAIHIVRRSPPVAAAAAAKCVPRSAARWSLLCAHKNVCACRERGVVVSCSCVRARAPRFWVVARSRF